MVPRKKRDRGKLKRIETVTRDAKEEMVKTMRGTAVP